MNDQPNPYASPASESSPPPEERRPSSEFPREMRRVRIGLSLIYYGVVGFVVYFFVYFFLGVLLWPLLFGNSFAYVLDGLQMFAVVGLVLASVLVGEAVCALVPKESGARGFALGVPLLQLGCFPLASIVRRVAPPMAGALAGQAAFVGSLVCFLLFLRQTSLFIGRPDIAGRATRTLVVGVISLLLSLPEIVMAQLGIDSSPEFYGWLPPPQLMGVFGTLGFLATFFMGVNTVDYLRKAINV